MQRIENGCYNLSSDSNISIFGYIYKNNFDPLDSNKNLLSQDGGVFNNAQFKFIISLQANIIYILVVSTYYPNVTGAFSIHVSAPNIVSFNRISEYPFDLVNS
jgi:hypothetical protein